MPRPAGQHLACIPHFEVGRHGNMHGARRDTLPVLDTPGARGGAEGVANLDLPEEMDGERPWGCLHSPCYLFIAHLINIEKCQKFPRGKACESNSKQGYQNTSRTGFPLIPATTDPGVRSVGISV